MRRREDVPVVDERAAAEEEPVDADGHLPREFLPKKAPSMRFQFSAKKKTKPKQNKKQCELGVVAPPLSYGHNEARESAQHQQSTTSPLTHGHSEPNLLLIAIRGGQLTLGSVSTPPTMRLVTSVTLVRRAIPQPSAADRTFV